MENWKIKFNKNPFPSGTEMELIYEGYGILDVLQQHLNEDHDIRQIVSIEFEPK